MGNPELLYLDHVDLDLMEGVKIMVDGYVPESSKQIVNNGFVSLGRQVHFVGGDGLIYPGTVTKVCVEAGTSDLPFNMINIHTLGPEGSTYPHKLVPHSEDHSEKNTWHYPPRDKTP